MTTQELAHRHVNRRLPTFGLIATLSLAAFGASAGPTNEAAWSDIQLTAHDRIMILAPHPDDSALNVDLLA